ncbi:type II toxin-antitoxin system RelE/ParE family toxin [uncultured Flavonifractor sp.]|uniref:type II toxin-antitoxin system RelE/ParE family toxin n=1 Tax=uncultured Flavonifractor sp. TaxID=1193534 RepID=UPI002593BF82|nr:type II toxin-antitoxin system RelE/ParE family toxin [uncultured Flavonifractor sp.]
MPKYSVKVNPRVGQQLESHAAFIANVSKPAARRLLAEFKELAKKLSENPYLYPVCEDPNLPSEVYRKAILGKWYKVLYCIEADCVLIEAVVDGRMQG